MKRAARLLAAMILVGAATPCAAAQSGRLYCGVYSMYAALQAVGKQPTLDELIDDRYISSRLGSTLADLQKIADDYEVSAVPMQGMTAGMLRDAPGPVVLHTRRPRRGAPYQHWIVYLGQENGAAKIIDPPAPLNTTPLAEILAQWDGVGLLVSQRPVSSWRAMRAGWLEQATVAALAACGMLAIASVVVPRARTRRFARPTQAAALLATSAALAIGYHAVSAAGFLRNPSAVASVVTAHHAANVPQLSLEATKSKLEKGAVLIDARFPSAFAAGTIPGAISLPISSTAAERAGFFSSLAADREAIVFCQSAECGWSDELASEMVLRGFQHVSVYRGGYREWQARAGAAKN